MSKPSNKQKTLSERLHEAVHKEIERCLTKLPELNKLKVKDIIPALPAAAMAYIHVAGTDTPIQVTWYRHNDRINVSARDDKAFANLDYTLSLGDVVPSAIIMGRLRLNHAAAQTMIARLR